MLSSCGAPTYQLSRNLVAPGKPTDKTFDELIALVQDHHRHVHPLSCSVLTSTPELKSQRNQLVSSYVAQLGKLSEFRGFKDSLKDMLRDRLVCGCKDKRLQCKLLAEKDLTFQ